MKFVVPTGGGGGPVVVVLVLDEHPTISRLSNSTPTSRVFFIANPLSGAGSKSAQLRTGPISPSSRSGPQVYPSRGRVATFQIGKQATRDLGARTSSVVSEPQAASLLF